MLDINRAQQLGNRIPAGPEDWLHISHDAHEPSPQKLSPKPWPSSGWNTTPTCWNAVARPDRLGGFEYVEPNQTPLQCVGSGQSITNSVNNCLIGISVSRVAISAAFPAPASTAELFVIDPPTLTLTIPGYGWATFLASS